MILEYTYHSSTKYLVPPVPWAEGFHAGDAWPLVEVTQLTQVPAVTSLQLGGHFYLLHFLSILSSIRVLYFHLLPVRSVWGPCSTDSHSLSIPTTDQKKTLNKAQAQVSAASFLKIRLSSSLHCIHSTAIGKGSLHKKNIKIFAKYLYLLLKVFILAGHLFRVPHSVHPQPLSFSHSSSLHPDPYWWLVGGRPQS